MFLKLMKISGRTKRRNFRYVSRNIRFQVIRKYMLTGKIVLRVNKRRIEVAQDFYCLLFV